jgi:predicted GIY-YIG superfamily endonuclease
VSVGQLLLIPDPRPLDERLGDRFFRDAPKEPGVYLMRDAVDRMLYVGKARNLRQRLRSYRIANPDRMPRRHLRMLRQVARIEIQVCSCEAAALERETSLLRTLKPKFNRAGVWPGKTRFIVWRRVEEELELAVTDTPEMGWQRYGPLRAGAWHLHRTLARLLWLAIHPGRAFMELPFGWARGKFADNVRIHCGDAAEKLAGVLAAFFWESPDGFAPWLESRLATRTHPFERAVIDGELETVKDLSARILQTQMNRLQMALL